jgi:hypothetical protein
VWRRASFAVGFCWLLGCTEPNFADLDGGCSGTSCDNGEREDDAYDAGASADGPPLETWQRQLMGRYAVRTYSFGSDGLVGIRTEEVAIVDIVRASAGLELRYATCTSTGSSINVPGSTEIAYPETIPVRSMPVTFDGTLWHTEATSTPVGYRKEPIVSCSAGDRVPRAPDQTWLSSTCLCPSSTTAPTAADDCRVNDVDGDDLPGISAIVTSGPVSSRYYGVLDNRDHFVKGTFDEGGAHFALFVSDGNTFLFGCDNPPCPVQANQRDCNPSHNAAYFERLSPKSPAGADWDCAAVKREINTLLPMAPPAFPDDC